MVGWILFSNARMGFSEVCRWINDYWKLTKVVVVLSCLVWLNLITDCNIWRLAEVDVLNGNNEFFEACTLSALFHINWGIRAELFLWHWNIWAEPISNPGCEYFWCCQENSWYVIWDILWGHSLWNFNLHSVF